MKKLAILFSILVAALFVAPGLIGFKVQSKYQDVISVMQQNGLEVVSDDYRRGWFGARAETKFKLKMPSGVTGKAVEFVMLNDIVHGPLSPDGGLALAAMGTSFKVDDKVLFPGEENSVLRTSIGLGGNGETQIIIPALKLAGKPGRPEIQFSGAEGSISFDTGLSQFDMDIVMPGLWVAGDKGESLKFTEVILQGDSKAGLFSLLLGSGKFKIKQIDFNNPKKNIAVKIDAINISSDTSESDGKLAIAADYAVESVSVNDVVYGPAQFQIDFANISAEVVAKLQKEIRKMRALKLTKEQESMAMINLLLGAGPDLLQANPGVNIKRLFVKTPDGDIDGSLAVTANGLQWGEIGNLQAVLQKLEAEAAISLPEKLFRAVMEMQAKVAMMRRIEQRQKLGHEITTPSEEELDNMGKEMSEQQLQFLLQQEIVKREGTNISSQAKLGSGLLSVNGKTIPLR